MPLLPREDAGASTESDSGEEGGSCLCSFMSLVSEDTLCVPVPCCGSMVSMSVQ